MASPDSLQRNLGVTGATFLGLGSILGTGVFVSIGLVAGLAGVWTIAAVAGAALLATSNALSSAQLAAAHPRSGGTYEYGYELLHPLAGFTAGWMFLWAKSASAATAALGFAGYVTNAFGVESAPIAVALSAVLVIVLTLLVAGGLRRSNVANIVIVGVTLVALALFVAGGSTTALERWTTVSATFPGPRAFLEATALMFVAYTGYGRVATLGEEVRDPRRTIPRAIVSTLVVSALLYVAVAAVTVGTLSGDALLQATEGKRAPLEIAARAFGRAGLPELVAVGAVTAMMGVLLNLLLGLSRVLFAMGRRGDMPAAVTRVDPRTGSPSVAVAVMGMIVLAITLVGSVSVAWSLSAFTVLVYYAITNLAALRLPATSRLYPKAWAVGGLIGCAFLAIWVRPEIWAAGLVIMALGVVWHVFARRRAGGG